MKEGILLYRGSSQPLGPGQALSPEERLAVANRNFHHWFDSASGFWRGCGWFMVRREWAHAAFLLHQAVERYFFAQGWAYGAGGQEPGAPHTVTLAESGYKHKTHDIAWLADLCATLHGSLVEAMPREEPEEKARFELLKRAYIDARYAEHFHITEAELTVLREQVRDLALRAREACVELLGRFCGAEALMALGPLPEVPEYGQESALPPPPDLDDPEAVERWSRAMVEEGRTAGRAEGKEEGLAEGEARGREAERVGIARSLLAKGMAEEEVAEVTGLSPAEVAGLSGKNGPVRSGGAAAM